MRLVQVIYHLNYDINRSPRVFLVHIDNVRTRRTTVMRYPNRAKSNHSQVEDLDQGLCGRGGVFPH